MLTPCKFFTRTEIIGVLRIVATIFWTRFMMKIAAAFGRGMGQKT
jgi:hypothetical protein